MQLPLCGNLVKGIITLRANRQAIKIPIIFIIIIIIINIININIINMKIIIITTKITTTRSTTITITITMKIHLQLQKDKIVNPRKPVLPEGLRNNLKRSNKSSSNLNNSRLPEKPVKPVKRFKFPVNSKLQILLYPLDPRSRQQILVFLFLFLFLFLLLLLFLFPFPFRFLLFTPHNNKKINPKINNTNTKTEIVKLFLKFNPNLTKIFPPPLTQPPPPPSHDQLAAKIMIPSDLPPLHLVQHLHW